MHYKLIAATAVAAALLGAPAIAYAQSDQSQAAPSASGQPEAKAPAARHVTRHKLRTSRFKSGTTTGLSSRSSTSLSRSRPGGEPISRKPE
jgi:hypothetical protein